MLSPKIIEGVNRLLDKFWRQCHSVLYALIANTDKLPIACIAVYGSLLKGVGPRSDIDILVLICNDYKERGFNLLDIKLDLEDIADDASVDDIPIDLHVSVAKDFLDKSRDTAFKQSVCEHNIVFWEDGETLGPYFIKRS